MSIAHWGSSARQIPSTQKSVATPKNQSVIKAFAILQEFRDGEVGLSSCELSRRVHLPQASAYRLIQTMEKIGVIAKGKRGRYFPGLALLSLSRSVPLLQLLREACEPILIHLAGSLDVTMNLGILEGSMVTYVATYSSAAAFPLRTRVGTQLEPYSSGLGKVLLAGLSKREVEAFLGEGQLVPLTPRTITCPNRLQEELQSVRQQGYATDDRETAVNARCLAVPIRDGHGRTIAAISASDEARRMPPSRQTKIRNALLKATKALQTVLYPSLSLQKSALSR
jgi:DNA-binding IclR family transcriptional regulator